MTFPSRITCFVGDNGAGKTNIMDAIYYLSMCKSAQTMSDAQCTRHGQEAFVAEGRYLSDSGGAEEVVCGFRRGAGKTFRRNGKEYERLSDHIGLFPVVVVAPVDTFLIHDAADQRRKYLNAIISQIDGSYLVSMVRYNHILEERNNLLKSPWTPASGDILEVLDDQLCCAGEAVHRRRSEIIAQLAPLTGEYYRMLSDDREKVELGYRSELNDTPLSDLLCGNRQRDMINRFTTSGVHRDDMVMSIGEHQLKKYGSQGQQKSFLVALKLAQYTITTMARGEKPILLLDDIFDKLDTSRVERLLDLVSGDGFGQIFITDCNKVKLSEILDSQGKYYSLHNIVNGEVL